MYRKKTPIYNIPYITDGERLESESELLAASIIENMLFAGTCGVVDALFEDGEYIVHDNGDGTVSVTIMPESEYSLCGIVKHRLFRTSDIVLFENIAKGSDYLLYIAYQPELDSDPRMFRKVVSQSIKEDPGFIVLARLDLRGETPILDEEPEGKLYSKDVLAHTSDVTNPHGRELHQDILDVNEKLTIRGNEVLGTVYKQANSAGGFQSVRIALDAIPVFVTIMPMEDGFGNWWCKFNGNEVLVYNSGMRGIPFTAEIKVQ